MLSEYMVNYAVRMYLMGEIKRIRKLMAEGRTSSKRLARIDRLKAHLVEYESDLSAVPMKTDKPWLPSIRLVK